MIIIFRFSGICDCCDGSDEDPALECPNTCEELERAFQQEAEASSRALKQALAKKAQMVRQGEFLLQEMTGAPAAASSLVPQ